MAKTLEQGFDKCMEHLSTHILPAEKIFPMVDLTCLDKLASVERIENLRQQAIHSQVAAICVLLEHLSWVLPVEDINRATVINFPDGNQDLDHIFQNMSEAFQQQVNEIDYVFPYESYLAGKSKQALVHFREAYEFSQQQGCFFKVILETGAWPNLESVYRIGRELIDRGCPMLKTSTGKIEIGATLPAAFSILTAIRDSRVSCGIKLSGGIKTLQQASLYAHLAEEIVQQSVNKNWFRIGASQIT